MLLRPISPAILEVTAPSFPDAAENVDNFRLRKSLGKSTEPVNCVLSEACEESFGESFAGNVETLDCVGVLIKPGRNPDAVEVVPVGVLGGRNALRDREARGDIGEAGGDDINDAVPSHMLPYSGEGLSLVGDVGGLSSSGFVLVICALATDVVVSGGAVVLRVGVKLDVRRRDGGPRWRLACTEGGRDEGAVL